jgi:hypothetical protein
MIKIFFYLVLLLAYLILAKGFAPSEKNYTYFTDAKSLANYLELEYPSNIILIDQVTKGEFFKTYFHKYRIIVLDHYRDIEVRTSPQFYKSNYNNLGLSLFHFTKETESSIIPTIPGIGFIGNDILGEWRNNSEGKKQWSFYNFDLAYYKVLGWGEYASSEKTFEKINTFQILEKVYRGSNKEFGLKGILTKNSFPNFFKRNIRKKENTFDLKIFLKRKFNISR